MSDESHPDLRIDVLKLIALCLGRHEATLEVSKTFHRAVAILRGSPMKPTETNSPWGRELAKQRRVAVKLSRRPTETRVRRKKGNLPIVDPQTHANREHLIALGLYKEDDLPPEEYDPLKSGREALESEGGLTP